MDEKTTDQLQRGLLTMKITYERLNQIIEEEVTKFKRLNEDASEIDGIVAEIKGYIGNDTAKLTSVKASLVSIATKLNPSRKPS